MSALTVALNSDGQHETVAFVGLEAGQREGDRVGARTQIDDAVEAVAVGDSGPTFSIRTSLEASTVTPGSTAPEVSLTTPVMDDWACATPGAKINTTKSSNFHAFLRI